LRFDDWKDRLIRARLGVLEVSLKFSRRSVVAFLLVLSSIGCGDKKSPTAPSEPRPATGVLTITELSVSAYGPPGDVTYLLSMRLNETGGQAAVTISSLTVGLDGGRNVTVPIDNARLNAGSSERLNNASFKDTTGAAASSRLTITMGYRADTGPGGSATASASVQALTVVTLSGVVTNRNTGAPIAGATVEVSSLTGPNAGKSTTTDAAGRYALTPLVAGAFNIRALANGYTGQSFPIDIATDAPFNIALAPTPPAVEYSVTGTARTCSVTYRSSTGGTSQARVTIPWSFSRSGTTGDFLYVSCQIDSGGDNGSIFVRILKHGAIIASASANGFPNIATADAVY
jgi:hypothetical protein